MHAKKFNNTKNEIVQGLMQLFNVPTSLHRFVPPKRGISIQSNQLSNFPQKKERVKGNVEKADPPLPRCFFQPGSRVNARRLLAEHERNVPLSRSSLAQAESVLT